MKSLEKESKKDIILILSSEEIQEVCGYLKNLKETHWKYPKLISVSLALFSGLRENEIATLEWEDVLFDCNSTANNGIPKVKRIFVPTHAKKDSEMPAYMNDISHNLLLQELQRKDCFAVARNDREQILKQVQDDDKEGGCQKADVGNREQILKQVRDDDNSLFVLGKKYSRQSVWRIWDTIQDDLWGIHKFRFHDLRHTAITNFYKKTRDICLTKDFARHKSLQNTMIYVHLAEQDKTFKALDSITRKFPQLRGENDKKKYARKIYPDFSRISLPVLQSPGRILRPGRDQKRQHPANSKESLRMGENPRIYAKRRIRRTTRRVLPTRLLQYYTHRTPTGTISTKPTKITQSR